MGAFSNKKLTLESLRGRDASGNPIVDAIDADAFSSQAGATLPLIKGMSLKALVGTVVLGDGGAITQGYSHEATPPAFYPAGNVEAFNQNEDGTRLITRFRLVAVSVGAAAEEQAAPPAKGKG